MSELKSEDVVHDILLIIVVALFILFITGLAGPLETGGPIVIPGG